MLVVLVRNLLRRITFDERIRGISRTVCLRDEDEKSDEDPKAKAAKKLNLLLQSIIKDEPPPDSEKPEKFAATFITKFKKKKIKKEEKPKNLGEKIVDAAKEITKNVDENREETEAQLLHKLLYKNENLQESVLKAANNKTLSELLGGMQIEKEELKKPTQQIKDYQYSRSDRVRALLKTSEKREEYPFERAMKINLFGSKRLNIFDEKDIISGTTEDEVKLETWDHCHSREIKLSITHPPSNIFEQMIIWTDRGMLWKFPIDNEQGLDDEKKVSFTEHVFLENHLEGWCPERGPIRHFMELVCVGLSRNHWLTAQEKKDHILWYKDYFLEKKDLIKELGAGEMKQPANVES